jgi:hypothetical protein
MQNLKKFKDTASTVLINVIDFLLRKMEGGEKVQKNKHRIKIRTFLNQKGKALFCSTPLILLTVSTINREIILL